MSRWITPGLVALAALGCITEHPKPAAPVRTAASPGAPGAPIQLPAGPLTRPIDPRATIVARVVVAMVPLGSVPYDGQVLPLFSPDGRFLATQTGQAPSWPTLLAEPAATVPAGTRILAFQLGAKAGEVTAVIWPQVLAPGLMLGRSADNQGFLVEAPQAGGARWIGRIAWVTGQLTWLVQDANVNAHATLGPRGELAYARRAAGAERTVLVYRAVGRNGRGGELTLASDAESYDFPVFSDSPRDFLVFAISPAPASGGVGGGTDALIVRPEPSAAPPAEPPAPTSLLVRSRLTLSMSSAAGGGRIGAFQAVAAIQTPLPAPRRTAAAPAHNPDADAYSTASPLSGLFLFCHPEQARMAVLDPESGSLALLAPASIAAAPMAEGTSNGQYGYLLTTPRGLMYQRYASPSSVPTAQGPMGPTIGVPVGVVPDPVLARLTTDEAQPYVLVGPQKEGGQLRLELFRMRPESSTPEPARR